MRGVHGDKLEFKLRSQRSREWCCGQEEARAGWAKGAGRVRWGRLGCARRCQRTGIPSPPIEAGVFGVERQSEMVVFLQLSNSQLVADVLHEYILLLRPR